MSALDQQYAVMLEKLLDEEFVPHLPPLLGKAPSTEQQSKKNRSRALSAFALSSLCGIPRDVAAKAVIDDFDDYGVDAVYYNAPSETLYLVQSKLKAAERFSQDEALAFCQGVRKVIRQDFSTFNKNVQDRLTEIEGALENCSKIQLLVAHTGAGISKHAQSALDELLADEDHGEERLLKDVFDYDAKQILRDLRSAKAYEKVHGVLSIQRCESVTEPRTTYFGLVHVADLVKLHEQHGAALYERNIRTFLGNKTEVNTSIQKTLGSTPQEFLYLNNGVTALCEIIEPKSGKSGYRRLKLRGMSVINGAQTIASSAKFVADNPGADISSAKVSITLIKADADGEFGKQVTRARNHQNPVHFSNFAALDDEQERLRKDLAHLGLQYAYKADSDISGDPKRIRIDEAAQALALLHPDPRFAIWLKKEPALLLDTTSDRYKGLFTDKLSAFQLANAVLLNRYVQARIAQEAAHANGVERLAYRHGNYALAWIFTKQLRAVISGTELLSTPKLKTELSASFDQLRQTHWDKTRLRTLLKGPLALFRNQADVIPLLRDVAVQHFGLTGDAGVEHKKNLHKHAQPYPEELFAYLSQKAPQIGNVT